MSAVRLEEREGHAYDPYLYSYVCPNEDVSIWREYAKGKRIDRAAGIASGGEVGLFSLLPTVRKELVLVDHSPGSLRFAIQKYLLIQQYGFNETQELFAGNRREDLVKALAVVQGHMPGPVDVNKKCLSHSVSNGREQTSLSKYWEAVPKRDGQRAARKLDKVTFVLGDFRSLEGPFDLFYLSNAWEAGNGNRKDIGIDSVVKLMKPGGLILATTRSDPLNRRIKPYCDCATCKNSIKAQKEPDSLELLESRRTESKTSYMTWWHNIYQVKEA